MKLHADRCEAGVQRRQPQEVVENTSGIAR